jgi:hypothetical protein
MGPERFSGLPAQDFEDGLAAQSLADLDSVPEKEALEKSARFMERSRRACKARGFRARVSSH